MRRAAKVDNGQQEIVAAFRRCNAKVLHTHRMGQGVPDLLVRLTPAHRAPILAWVEVKDGTKPPSAQKLTPMEEEFCRDWHPVYIARSPADVPDIIQAVCREEVEA